MPKLHATETWPKYKAYKCCMVSCNCSCPEIVCCVYLPLRHNHNPIRVRNTGIILHTFTKVGVVATSNEAHHKHLPKETKVMIVHKQLYYIRMNLRRFQASNVYFNIRNICTVLE